MRPAPPNAVVKFAAGREVRLVWENEAGGLTYAVGDLYVPDPLRTAYYRLLWDLGP